MTQEMKGYYYCEAKFDNSTKTIRAGSVYRVWVGKIHGEEGLGFCIETSEGDAFIWDIETFLNHFKVLYQ